MKKILLMADCKKWAWGIKCRYIKKYLDNNPYSIDIVYLDEGDKYSDVYDLYITFSPKLAKNISTKIDKNKIIAGVTSHLAYDSYLKNEDMNNKCVAIHANSIMLLNLAKKNHKKVFYTPNGVDTNMFKEKPNNLKYDGKRTLFVGYVGKEIASKGLNEFIKPAISKVKNCVLLTNTKSWKRPISHEEMYTFYHKIDYYIIASIMDGTPNGGLEAASCGVPIISNKIGNMPEFIKNSVNGFLFNDRNIDEYSKKLIYVRDHPDIYKNMSEESRKQAIKWDWKIQVDNYKKMFEEVLK